MSALTTSVFNTLFDQYSHPGEYKVVSDVSVSPDNMARMRVAFSGVEYNITVGSDFVEGLLNNNSATKEKLSKQLAALLQTMKDHTELKTAFVNDNQFSYNGKVVDLNKVETHIPELERKIRQEQVKFEPHDTALATLRQQVADATIVVNDLAPKTNWFGNPETLTGQRKTDYDNAVIRKTELGKQFAEREAALNKKKEEALKELQRELTDNKAGLTFLTTMKVGKNGLAAAVKTPAAPPTP